MIEKQFLVALGALSLALGACSSDMTGTGENGGPGTNGVGNNGSSGNSGAPGTGGNGTSGTGSSTGGGAGTSAGAAGTAGVGGAAGTGGGGPTDVCVPGVPASSQVPRMLNAQYDNVMRDLLGVTTLAAASNGLPSSLLADDSQGSLTDISWNAYLTTAEKIAGEVMAGANKSKFIECDPAVGTCLVDTIRSFGRKAFRRPLTEAEVASFQRLNNLTPKGTPTEVAEAVLYAFLASPSFILLPELAQTPEGAGFALSSHEVASRLSFLIWGSIPDKLLSDAADAGQLATKEQILAQAQRMVLVREKTAPMVASFHRYWADIRLGSHWASIEHDTMLYPNWKSTVNATMMAEVDKFFEEVAFQNGAFKDLFLSPVAYVNADTAPIYGLPAASYGTALTRVELDPNQRPGFLTRVGFLASFSSGSNTSPILRGAYISKNVLGTKIEDPPPEASKTPVPPGNYTTQRQIVTALTSGDMCQGCHASVINPWGFPLEVYDSIGGMQTVDPLGGAIDATSEVDLSDGTTQAITSPIELMTLLGTGRDARRRYAEQWVTYTTGRVPNQNDACLVNDLNTKLSSDGYTILNVIADLTQADSFRLRTVGN